MSRPKPSAVSARSCEAIPDTGATSSVVAKRKTLGVDVTAAFVRGQLPGRHGARTISPPSASTGSWRKLAAINRGARGREARFAQDTPENAAMLAFAAAVPHERDQIRVELVRRAEDLARRIAARAGRSAWGRRAGSGRSRRGTARRTPARTRATRAEAGRRTAASPSCRARRAPASAARAGPPSRCRATRRRGGRAHPPGRSRRPCSASRRAARGSARGVAARRPGRTMITRDPALCRARAATTAEAARVGRLAVDGQHQERDRARLRALGDPLGRVAHRDVEHHAPQRLGIDLEQPRHVARRDVPGPDEQPVQRRRGSSRRCGDRNRWPRAARDARRGRRGCVAANGSWIGFE